MFFLPVIIISVPPLFYICSPNSYQHKHNSHYLLYSCLRIPVDNCYRSHWWVSNLLSYYFCCHDAPRCGLSSVGGGCLPTRKIKGREYPLDRNKRACPGKNCILHHKVLSPEVYKLGNLMFLKIKMGRKESISFMWRMNDTVMECQVLRTSIV